jgi:hypothetical protein
MAEVIAPVWQRRHSIDLAYRLEAW